MNSVLFGAMSLGLMMATFNAGAPELQASARAAADDAEVARLMEAAPDEGFMGATILTDAETGEETRVDMIAFNDK
jgi:hypothetical protein